VQARVSELDSLLLDRARSLRARSRGAEEAFNAGGPPALVDVIHAALATSIYPEGLRGGSRAEYLPESRELLIDYELPRQEVIPAVVSYRYVKTTDELRPEPRKDADIKKLYRQLIARLALRTSPRSSKSHRSRW